MIELTVNGQAIRYAIAPETPLLHALREVSHLTGAKYGCGTGECGACTVLVDGRAVASCRVSIAAVRGAAVTTIEGLAADRDHPVPRAFAEAGAIGCGYCLPGFVMGCAALIAADPDPDDAAIDAALTHLCRCGLQPRIRRAVRRAAAAARGVLALPPLPAGPVAGR